MSNTTTTDRETVQPSITFGEWIDQAGLAQVLGMSVSTIARLWRAGLLPRPIRVGRRALRWHLPTLEKWLIEQTEKGE